MSISRKRKKYKKKSGTKKNIFNLLKNRELKGKIIDTEIPSKFMIRHIRQQIKENFSQYERAQSDGDEDKRINLAIILNRLIENIKAESPNLNNADKMQEFMQAIEIELQEEAAAERRRRGETEEEEEPEPALSDSDSNEGHHSGRSSPSSASSKKRKKRKKTKGKGKSLVNKYYMHTLTNPPNISSLHKSGIQLIEDISYAPGVKPRVEPKKITKKTKPKPKGSGKNTRIKRKH